MLAKAPPASVHSCLALFIICVQFRHETWAPPVGSLHSQTWHLYRSGSLLPEAQAFHQSILPSPLKFSTSLQTQNLAVLDDGFAVLSSVLAPDAMV